MTYEGWSSFINALEQLKRNIGYNVESFLDLVNRQEYYAYYSEVLKSFSHLQIQSSEFIGKQYYQYETKRLEQEKQLRAQEEEEKQRFRQQEQDKEEQKETLEEEVKESLLP